MLPSLDFIPHPACVASLCPRSFVIQVMLLPVFNFTYSYPLPFNEGGKPMHLKFLPFPLNTHRSV